MARMAISDPQAVAVLAPESFGSVGDQAMLEVMREQLVRHGFKPTFVYLPGWRKIPLRSAAPHTILNYSTRIPRRRWSTIARSGAMVLVGADVVDGSYGRKLPSRWIAKLGLAQEAGARVGIVSFSVSPEADPAIVEQLRATEGFHFTPRDPVSLARFTRATGQPATQSADLAFLLTPELRAPTAVLADAWLAARKAAGDTVMFVNVGGPTLARMPGDGVAVMEDVMRQWLDASAARSIFLVPHDFRPTPYGDMDALERLLAPLVAAFPERVAMLRPPFDAWDVKALCHHADLALSGRMHLAIACLGMGVPVVSVVYVGKFEGLMQHFGLADEDLLIETGVAPQADRILARIERVTAQRDRLSAIIRSRLDAVKALAARNFDWL